MNGFKKSDFMLNVLRTFLFAVAAMFIIFISTGGELFTLKHLFLYSICSIPLCFLCAYSIEKLGSVLGNAFSGWSSKKTSLRETLSADFAKAKLRKRRGEYKEAFKIINEVLVKDTEFADAIYLKAQILWEGFKDREGALECLRKVMILVPKQETLHRWASNLFIDIKG